MTVQQITKGIKISVKTKEEGFIQENELDYYNDAYHNCFFIPTLKNPCGFSFRFVFARLVVKLRNYTYTKLLQPI